jgi:hypothetical protein
VYFSLDDFFQNHQSTKALAGMLCTNSYVVLAILGYIFVSKNLTQIIDLLNNLLEISSARAQSGQKIKVFSRSLIFQLVFLQSLMNLIFVTAFFLVCLSGTFVTAFTLFVLLFIQPGKLVLILARFLIDLTTRLIQSECENSKNVREILQLTEKICKMFDSYISISIFIQHFFILLYLFGVLSSLMNFLIGIDSDYTNYQIPMVFSVALFIEHFNMKTMIGTCRNFRRSVRMTNVKDREPLMVIDI